MRCHHCGAPRRSDAQACPFCSAEFTAAHPPSTVPGSATGAGPQAWDAAFVKMRRQPRTEALLQERSGLPRPPGPGALGGFLPLVIFGGIGAALLFLRRGADGSFDQVSLIGAAAFVGIGLAATFAGLRRHARFAKQPIEGRLVRLGAREATRTEPISGDEHPSPFGGGKLRWVVALEDGTERHVWPLLGARGAERMQRGAGGVAWLQGERLYGFEPIEC